MVNAELHEGQNPKEEANVRVITWGVIHTKIDLEQREILGKIVEGNIQKEVKPPPKFDVEKQNQYICDAPRVLDEANAHE